MLSLSKKTDYALLALSHLTRCEGARTVNTKEIAEQYEIPIELLAKILQSLTRGGLIVSTPGPAGGYRLARPAAEISVGSVVALVEGRPAIAHCMKTIHNACGQRNRCTIRRPLERINARMLQMLDSMSLAEISQTETADQGATDGTNGGANGGANDALNTRISIVPIHASTPRGAAAGDGLHGQS